MNKQKNYSMSGGLLHSFRQGNRSELLADYLLSAIGIATPVRRQDDFGFDFYCQLSDQEEGYLTFGYPFILQVKSYGSNNVVYGNTDSNKWKQEGVQWLFRNKLPFFLGMVDREAGEIKIYDTTGIWQVYNDESIFWSQIELTTSERKTDEWRNNCQKIKIKNWPEGKGDGYRYIIDLGNPIINLTYNDLTDESLLRKKKAILKEVICWEQTNIIHRDLGIRGFLEVKSNGMNIGYIGTGMALSPQQPIQVEQVYSSLKIGLISLLIGLNNQGRTNECIDVKNVLRNVPVSNIDEQLYNISTDLFDYVKKGE